MRKILSSFRTHPEVINKSPVYDALKKSNLLNVKFAFTVHYREILEKFRDFLLVIPFFDFKFVKLDQCLSEKKLAILLSLKQMLNSLKISSFSIRLS